MEGCYSSLRIRTYSAAVVKVSVMDRILQSQFDASTKQSLAELFETVLSRAMARPALRATRGELEEAIASALVDLASVGQRSPEQLARYAEYRASVI